MTRKRYVTAAMTGVVAASSLLAPQASALIDGDTAQDNAQTQSVAKLTLYSKNEAQKLTQNNTTGTARLPVSLCTGTLIAKQWVIAAKHCGDSPDTIGTISFGVNSDGKNEYTVDKVVGHNTDDIALYHITKPASATPAKLWDKSFIDSPTKGTAYGWGAVDSQGNTTPAKNLTTDSATMDNKFVRGTPHPTMDVNPADYTKARATQGDSGSPFMIDNSLYGVLSMKSTEDKERNIGNGDLGFYMPVVRYAEWINATVKDKVATPVENTSPSTPAPVDDSAASIDTVTQEDDKTSSDTTSSSDESRTSSSTTSTPSQQPDSTVETDVNTVQDSINQAQQTPTAPVESPQNNVTPSRALAPLPSESTPGPKVNTGGAGEAPSFFDKVVSVIS